MLLWRKKGTCEKSSVDAAREASPARGDEMGTGWGRETRREGRASSGRGEDADGAGESAVAPVQAPSVSMAKGVKGACSGHARSHLVAWQSSL